MEASGSPDPEKDVVQESGRTTRKQGSLRGKEAYQKKPRVLDPGLLN